MTDARNLTLALGGVWRGSHGMARCPCHDDHTPSLSIRDGNMPGRVLVKCWAGCNSTEIIRALQRRGFLEKPTGINARLSRDGLSVPERTKPLHRPDPEAIEKWRAAKPADGTIVEQYLRNRSIGLPVPPTLRASGMAMIAGVQAPDRQPISVQITQLTIRATRSQGSVSRPTHGSLGHGAVRLAAAGAILGIAEGIETGLSAMQITGIPTWCCLGSARMHRVQIPQSVRELVIFADADDPGRLAAERTVEVHEGRCRVTTLFPPGQYVDWNDALQAEKVVA